MLPTTQHTLAYAAMMTGQRQLAVEHIRAMVTEMPEEVVKEFATHAEAFLATPYEVLVRFGRWDEILAEPDHPEFMVFTRAFRHAARGIAYAAKGDLTSARAEQAAFLRPVNWCRMKMFLATTRAKPYSR